MQTDPNARRLPIPQSPPTTHAGAAAHLGRQHFPRQPRAQHEQDARECGPVLNWTTPALRTRPRRREERRDLIPEIIGEKQSGHAKPTLKTKLGAVLLGVLSVRTTPTLFLNGDRYVGALPADVFDEIVRKLPG